MPSLTISIVNFNSGEYLIRCLASIEAIIDEVTAEVYVVDNNSSDNSVDKIKARFPKVKLILNQQNLGFARAHNQVLKKVTSDYLLVLNPDMILKKGSLAATVGYLEQHQNVGALTPKIFFENGEVDLAAHRGFPTPWASLLYFLGDDSLYHLTKSDMSKPHQVDAITGAFFLTKKEVLEKVGYFDTDYFMYAEDLDLCYRIKQAGLKVVFLPTTEVIHYKGISSGLKKNTQKLSSADIQTKQRSLDYFYSTMKIFYRKHLEEKYPFFINWLVYLGINLRWWLAKSSLTV